MHPKVGKVKKTEITKKKIAVDTTKILRTVNDNEAFYFYEALGKPTGEKANSLAEFAEKVKTAKLESLMFHIQRKDFQNWIEKTLGDKELASRIAKLPLTNKQKARTQLQSIVEKRITELNTEPSMLLIPPTYIAHPVPLA
ncbi:hypothetical protein KEJ15_05315 [Candidatus Bathyarchaeota archaeon]|nr:hypothetical protein [Candidatus Bathyarchaeota archaeon]